MTTRTQPSQNLLADEQGLTTRTQPSKNLLADEQGLTTVEYVIILFLIAVSGIVIWREFGCTVHDSVGLAAFEIQELGD